MKKSLFTIDGFAYYYVGYTNGMRWNGWEMPFLPKSEVLRLLDTEHLGTDEFKWEGDALFLQDTQEGEIIRVNADVINGEIVYQVGDGWVWEEAKIEGEVLVKDVSGRGYSARMSAMDYALNNPEESEAIEWLMRCPELGDQKHLEDTILISL